MRRLAAALALLTRIPVPTRRPFDARDVGRATPAFPVVGALLGVISVGASRLLVHALPTGLCAVLVVGLSALVTGAIHLDGLADMADGFGGTRTREDTLRVMRDHTIGVYGAVALIVVLAAKMASADALLRGNRFTVPLVVAPVLARWSPAVLGYFLPYARRDEGLGDAVATHVGRTEVFVATALALGIAVGLARWRGVAYAAVAAACTGLNAAWCMKRIGGITGDTIGANTEVVETAVYVLAVALG